MEEKKDENKNRFDSLIFLLSERDILDMVRVARRYLR